MKIIAALLLVLIPQVLCLTFRNELCDGKACPFQVNSITFNGYSLSVKGHNNGNTDLVGGTVDVVVDIQVFFWMNAYTATDPTCSYQGTDCDANGVLVKANSDKAFVLTMATEDDPPSGTYRGTAFFYNTVNGKKVPYANVKMDWRCDSTKCM